MKIQSFLLLIFICLNLSTCKDDDDSLNCDLCHPPEEAPTYMNYAVDFFTTHKDLIVQPAVFETVTEQVLVKEAHQQGAIFQTFTEQILTKEAYLDIQISTSQTIHLVSNSETDLIVELECFHFFPETNIIETEVPAEYMSRTYELMIQQGTGPEVPATYETITRRRVLLPASIALNTSAQEFRRLTFRIPAEKSIRTYLITQFAQQSIVSCLEGNSYEILE